MKMLVWFFFLNPQRAVTICGEVNTNPGNMVAYWHRGVNVAHLRQELWPIHTNNVSIQDLFLLTNWINVQCTCVHLRHSSDHIYLPFWSNWSQTQFRDGGHLSLVEYIFRYAMWFCATHGKADADAMLAGYKGWEGSDLRLWCHSISFFFVTLGIKINVLMHIIFLHVRGTTVARKAMEEYFFLFDIYLHTCI